MSRNSTAKTNYILTFGYGNRSNYDAFLEYLEKFSVVCVVDVRINPRAWTRKWYGEAVEKICVSRGIKYISRTSLGNTSGQSNWISPDHMEAEKALLEVSEIVRTGSILLLCAEKDSSRCHRVDVANQLQRLIDASIEHLK